ncbi:MAG: amino acid permease [Bdellovibrionales bacterium]|nr:amino acid permease [Bdellovibrionales bacterium]
MSVFPMESSADNSIHTELSRDLGLKAALAIGVGTMIAAGIFTLSGLAVRNVGSSAIISFLAAAVIALCTALSYCEFSSIYPESGEGYLYARKTFSPLLAYMVGWALYLGYTASCGFYIASLSTYFQEFIWHLPLENLSGIIAITLLTLLNIKGTKESTSFQIVITLAKVLLLIWFIIGGLKSVGVSGVWTNFSNDLPAIARTSGLVFITFFGFSAIAASAGEVQDPRETIPKAIFISMIVVTILYTLVVIVMIGANLSEYTEAAMGEAARMFLGPTGGMVIIGGALFSMISASNASIIAGSRVVHAMSRHGHLPSAVGSIDPLTKTPIVAVVLVGVTISLFVIGLPLEELAHFADTVLLLALVMVNLCLIVHRKKYADMERPFRVPLVPILPIIGMMANLYLLMQIAGDKGPFLLALGSLVLGFFGFFAWKGMQTEEQALPGSPSTVLHLTRSSPHEGFSILVPIANPENIPQVIALAASIAIPRSGRIILLRVVGSPEQAPIQLSSAEQDREYALLQRAQDLAKQFGVPSTSILRLGNHIARAILETSREKKCELVLLGWTRDVRSKATKWLFGSVVDEVANHARADVMLVKLEHAKSIRSILVPTAGGPHARAAEDYARSISEHFRGVIEVCRVVPQDATDVERAVALEQVEEAKSRILARSSELDVKTLVLEDASISAGITKAAKSYDLIVIGATRKSVYQDVIFGNIPEELAQHVGVNVIVVKRHQAVSALLGRVLSS